jgi:bifunctional UDP-N-acetylglucosamine pyrophosphorylase / glucosamine-1-phosphate N-acetyltransferase
MSALREKHKSLGAIVLAAGKGKRMNSKSVNKVALQLADKPMILHTIHLLRRVKVEFLIVVVGFAKQSVMKLLDEKIIFAEQKKRLGTAHAVSCALKKIPENVNDVLVLNGDDSAFYDDQTIKNLVKAHFISDAALTLLTIEKTDPFGLGRIIRDSSGKVQSIIEEKDATIAQRKINEINPGCYVFNTNFLRKYLKQVKKSPITGEYYLTSLIDIGIKHNQKIESLKISLLPWRGVNTKDELVEAEHLFLTVKK